MYITRDSAIWKKSVFVLIDLEYSGNLEDAFGANCNIWEIAACCGQKTFHALINPSFDEGRGITPCKRTLQDAYYRRISSKKSRKFSTGNH